MARKVIHGGLHAAGGRLDADDLQPEPDVDVMPGQLRDAGHGNGMIRKCGVGPERSATLGRHERSPIVRPEAVV